MFPKLVSQERNDADCTGQLVHKNTEIVHFTENVRDILMRSLYSWRDVKVAQWFNVIVIRLISTLKTLWTFSNFLYPHMKTWRGLRFLDMLFCVIIFNIVFSILFKLLINKIRIRRTEIFSEMKLGKVFDEEIEINTFI